MLLVQFQEVPRDTFENLNKHSPGPSHQWRKVFHQEKPLCLQLLSSYACNHKTCNLCDVQSVYKPSGELLLKKGAIPCFSSMKRLGLLLSSYACNHKTCNLCDVQSVYKPSGELLLKKGAIPCFSSMKRLRVFQLPPGWDASLSQGYASATQSKVSCPAQEHNAVPQPGARTWTTQFGAHCTNH